MELITFSCVLSRLDTTYCIYREEAQLTGIASIYVDDVIAAETKTIREKLLSGSREIPYHIGEKWR